MRHCYLNFSFWSFIVNNQNKTDFKVLILYPAKNLITWTIVQFSSVQFNLSVVSDSLWPNALQHARPPCPSPTPGVYSNSFPLSQWCHPTISSSVIPFSSFQSLQHQNLFQWVSSSHQVGKLLEFQLQHQSFQWTFRTDFLQDWLVGFPCSPRKTLKSLLQHHSSKISILWRFIYRANFTLIYDYWENYSLDLEKAMAPHYSTLAWKIPWTEEPGGLQSMGSLRVGYHWVTSLSLFTFMHWRRKWQPIPVFLPGESQGLGSLVGCCLWGRTESDMTAAPFIML